MNPVELVGSVAAYLFGLLSLGLASWAVAETALPRPTRLGLRLLAIVAGEMVFCAILVQGLGLLGRLTFPFFLAASLAPGIAVLWFWRERRPLQALFGLLERAFRLWVVAPRYGVGWLGALFLLYLAKRSFFLPQDIDALTLHAPLVAQWVASGRVSLASFWSYPQCWEYQFVPSFLLLRSDVLVIVPALLAIVAILLATSELAARLGLGGRIGSLTAFLMASTPVLWRDALKADPIFAVALLLGILAGDRTARGQGGGFWLLQLAIFLVLGTKPTGFLYAGALGAFWLWLWWRRGRGQGRRGLLPGLLFTLVFQASAVAVQARNWIANGNPVHPLQLKLLGRVIFPGPGDLSGTSILENAGQLETWRRFLLGGSVLTGAELPLLLLLLAAALALTLRSLIRREPRRARATLALVLPGVALVLWVLFLATPWSCGLARGAHQFLIFGTSLRYAIAPLVLTCLVAMDVGKRGLGRRALGSLLAVVTPLLVFANWSLLRFLGDPRIFLWKFCAGWLLVAAVAYAWRRWRPDAGRRPGIRMAAAALAILCATAAFARWAEGIREAVWVPAYKEVWSHVYDELPRGSRIATNDAMASFRYFLYGRGYENEVVVVDLGKNGDSGLIPEDVTSFYLFASRGEGQRQRLIAAMEKRGWRVLARPDDRQTALLVRP